MIVCIMVEQGNTPIRAINITCTVCLSVSAHRDDDDGQIAAGAALLTRYTTTKTHTTKSRVLAHFTPRY